MHQSAYPPVLKLQWHVTERCNLRCAHCYQAGVPGAELGFQDSLKVLDQLGTFLAERDARGWLTLTGGEPFVRPDFMALVEAALACRARFETAILSNGTLIDAALARRLRSSGIRSVQVSIDGERATHDAIRGAGSFDRAVAGIQQLVRAGVTTVIAFTAHRANYRQFPEVARLGRALGVARVWTDRLIPLGQGYDLYDQSLTPAETAQYVDLIAASRTAYDAFVSFARLFWRPRGRTEIATNRALQFLGCGGQPYHCAAGDTLAALLPDGDLCPCRRLPVRVGNVLQTSLKELYDCGQFRVLRDHGRVSAGCAGCVYQHLCGGGLHCLAYATTGDPFRADPGCWLTHPIFEGERRNDVSGSSSPGCSARRTSKDDER